MKGVRQAKILEIINKFQVETQEELIDKLKSSGFDVTQATISRDIKELRLVKTLASGGRYKYSSSSPAVSSDITNKFQSIFYESVIGVDHVGNIVTLKCYTGMANAACAALDSMQLDGVVGSIAGDDTIFVLVRTADAALRLMSDIKKIIKK